MGYMRHHAIVVTGQEDRIALAHEEASKRFDSRYLTGVTETAVNGYRSFLVAPDGSKEGWTESKEMDELRRSFVAYLRTQFLGWVEVQFDDDDNETKVIACNDDGHGDGYQE